MCKNNQGLGLILENLRQNVGPYVGKALFREL